MIEKGRERNKTSSARTIAQTAHNPTRDNTLLTLDFTKVMTLFFYGILSNIYDRERKREIFPICTL
jgi:hypothetical protein